MKTRTQRLFQASAILALSGAFLAATLPARAATLEPSALATILPLKRPDLKIASWSVGVMWSTAANTTVPAVIVKVQNVGNRASNESTTRIVHNSSIYNIATPVLSMNQSFDIAV